MEYSIRCAPSGWGWIVIPGASQVKKGEHKRSDDMYRFEPTVLILLVLYASCMRSDHVCSTVALDVLMLSWFGLGLLCTSHAHMHRDYWHKIESLERSCRCTAAAVPLLYCCILILWSLGCAAVFAKKIPALLDRSVCLHQHMPHSQQIQKCARIHAKAPSVAVLKECTPRTNARMGRVDRNWTKSGGRLSPMARGFVSG